MKTLYLVRHAKAYPRDSGINDFVRPLIKQGKSEAESVGTKLKKKEIMPDLIISSPANRAIATAHILAKALGCPEKNIVLNDAIYNARGKTLLKILNNTEEKYASLMLVGHEPALSELMNILANNFKEIIPTSGVICVEFRKNNWRSIEKGGGTMRFLETSEIVPDEPGNYKKLKNELEDKIVFSMDAHFREINGDIAGKIYSSAKKLGRKAAKEFVRMLKNQQKKST